jgi:hypothetical protein
MLRTVDLAVAMPIRIQTAEDVNASLPADAHGLVVQSETDATFSVCDETVPRHRRTSPVHSGSRLRRDMAGVRCEAETTRNFRRPRQAPDPPQP